MEQSGAKYPSSSPPAILYQGNLSRRRFFSKQSAASPPEISKLSSCFRCGNSVKGRKQKTPPEHGPGGVRERTFYGYQPSDRSASLRLRAQVCTREWDAIRLPALQKINPCTAHHLSLTAPEHPGKEARYAPWSGHCQHACGIIFFCAGAVGLVPAATTTAAITAGIGRDRINLVACRRISRQFARAVRSG